MSLAKSPRKATVKPAASPKRAKSPSRGEPAAQAKTQGKQPTAFGALLREYRTTRGISQADLAHNAMVSPGYVGLIETGERGERPSLDIVKRFAQGLSASVDELEALMRAAGHLGEHESLVDAEQPTVQAIVERDKFLTKSQKAILVSLYEDMLRRG